MDVKITCEQKDERFLIFRASHPELEDRCYTVALDAVTDGLNLETVRERIIKKTEKRLTRIRAAKKAIAGFK